MREDPTTIADTLKAIKAAKRVYVTPRFGVSEKMVRTTKADARWLLAHVHRDTTPEGYEMASRSFGRWLADDEFHLG